MADYLTELNKRQIRHDFWADFAIQCRWLALPFAIVALSALGIVAALS